MLTFNIRSDIIYINYLEPSLSLTGLSVPLILRVYDIIKGNELIVCHRNGRGGFLGLIGYV